MKRLWLLLIFMIAMSNMLFADGNHQKSFDDGTEWAKKLLQAPQASDLTVIKILEPNFTTDPIEATYDAKTLEAKKSEIANSETMKFIKKSHQNSTQFETIMEEGWVTKYDKVIEHPEQVFAQNYKDCKQVPILSKPILKTTTMSCREANEEFEASCVQTLKIEVQTEEETKKHTFYPTPQTLQPENVMKNKTYFANILKENPNHILSIKHAGWSYPIHYIGDRTTAAEQIYEFRIRRSKITSETWVSNCGQLEKLDAEGFCDIIDETCIDGPSTKDINGMAITRPCWQKKLTYRCGSSLTSKCPNYRKMGCEQVAQKCVKKIGDHCIETLKTYHCQQQIQNPTGQYKLICADMPFCLNGDCIFDGYEANNDMLEAISKLKIFEALGKELQKEGLHVFTGECNRCRKNAFGFRSCCGKGSGWGKSFGAKCSESEKALAYKREQGLCHNCGSYCAKKIAGKCIEKKQSFCCYKSKIVRIIHEQIRSQIGLDWGSGKNPNCRGLTIEELSKADWEKLDLSELFHEILDTLDPPDLGNLQKTVSLSLKEKLQQSTKSGVILPKGVK